MPANVFAGSFGFQLWNANFEGVTNKDIQKGVPPPLFFPA